MIEFFLLIVVCALAYKIIFSPAGACLIGLGVFLTIASLIAG